MVDSPFLSNVYAGFPVDRTVDLSADRTDQGQAKSVRKILDQFAVTGQDPSRSDVRGSYAAEFADDIPIDSPSVDHLLEMPDLDDMDEMDFLDYVRDHSSEPVSPGSPDPGGSPEPDSPGSSDPEPATSPE